MNMKVFLLATTLPFLLLAVSSSSARQINSCEEKSEVLTRALIQLASKQRHPLSKLSGGCDGCYEDVFQAAAQCVNSLEVIPCITEELTLNTCQSCI
eukprot:05192.XXX_128969_129423_1 [CDS] Oithona nana genome sequencing.